MFIVLTETWLTDSIHYIELGMVNYNVFRYDRCNLSSTHSRGGGVLIGIIKYIPSSCFTVPFNNVEQIFVQFSIGFNKFMIGSVYVPPHSCSNIYDLHAQTLEYIFKQFPKHTFILCGDYNLPEITWSNDDTGLLYTYTSTPRAPIIPETFISHNFFQKNNILN